jgi:oxygen-dependent protoporphyrinogen oxidase
MKKRVTVIGAGFSGLASAFYLVRAGFEVEIFEERERSGGLISTVKTPHGLVETAANGFLNSRFVEDLFTAVNVPMIGTTPTARRRYIFREGLCRRWPLGVGGSLRVLGFLLRYFFDRTAIEPRDGESVATWSRRVLGEEASRYLVEAGLQGIYAGDPSRMSARLIVGRFFTRMSADMKPASSGAARFFFPRTRLRGTVAPPEGMGQLIAALEAYLRSQGVVFHFGRPASIPVLPSQPTIVATNPASAARLLAKVLPEKASLLSKVSLNPIVTTTAFFSSTDRATEGFGVLFPPAEHRRALGVLKNDFIFDRLAGGSEQTESSVSLAGHERRAMSFRQPKRFS